MFLHSTFSRIATVAAAGTVAALAVSGTAVAAPAVSTAAAPMAHHQVYKGRVIANGGLLVRSGPSANYRVVGTLHKGQTVWISCKVVGSWVDGNNRWYKLADGRWAYASARYIVNIGTAPRWC